MFHQVTKLIGQVCAITGTVLAIAACGGAAAPDYVTVAPPSLSPGSPVPAPTGEVILTLSGNLTMTNVGDTLQFDLPTLEKLGLVEYSVFDPWLLKETTYTGVLLSELNRFAGVPDSATKLRLTALDDYEVDISLADVARWPVLLATRSNGEYMSIENSGPTRIVFPYDSYPEIDPVAYKDLWIWNLKAIEID